VSDKKASRYGWLVAILGVSYKIGPKALPMVGKLFKVAKGSKVAMAAVSFGAWSIFLDWRFVFVLMGSLFLHELGHIRAMKAYGLQTKGIYFIPFMGGVAVSKEAFPTRKAEAVIALWGPLWGFILALAALALYTITGIPLIAGIAAWIGLINLFNLLPMNPLDGGRVTKSVLFSFSTKITFPFLFVAAIAALFLLWKLNFGIAILICAFGLGELFAELGNVRVDKDRKNIITALAAALGVEPKANAIIARIKSVFADIERYEADYKVYEKQFRGRGWLQELVSEEGLHIRVGSATNVDGGLVIPRPEPVALPAGLLDPEIAGDDLGLLDDSYGAINPFDYKRFVKNIIYRIACRSLTEYKRIISRKVDTATGFWLLSMSKSAGGTDEYPLFKHLTGSSIMPVMTRWQATLTLIAYIVLIVALLAVMFAAAVAPSAQTALIVFMS